ncbi:MAG: ComEC/Rec2 family competence protein [Candidatus Omnitrophica bacterium]|nr:ComEC/Rec2 family competence protein [Candidatus Omnitrophota bacterium]
MKYSLFISALIFSCGIIFANFLKLSFVAVYLSGLFALSLCLLFFCSKDLFNLTAAVAIFLLGAIWHLNHNIPDNKTIARSPYYLNKETTPVKGFIAEPPQLDMGRCTFKFETEAVQIKDKSWECRGTILVNTRSKEKLNYGDEFILYGKLFRPFGEGGYAAYLHKQGIKLLISVPAGAGITKLNKNKGFPLRRLSYSIKDSIQARLYRYLSPISAGITDAMLLGNKKNIPAMIYKSMMKTGTVHILVVSGFNVGIVAVLADMLLKIVRLKRKLRIVLVIGIIIIYCFATGASNPVVRATVMAIMILSAVLIKRQADIYNSLGLAAMFILLINPQQLFDIGFQLSFLSVLAIVFLYPIMGERFCVEKIAFSPAKVAMEGFLVSLSAWIGTSVLIFYYFRSISLVAVLANIFIVPIATFITLNGFALAALSSINPCLARLFAPVSELAVTILLGLNSAFLMLPGAYLSLK